MKKCKGIRILCVQDKKTSRRIDRKSGRTTEGKTDMKDRNTNANTDKMIDRKIDRKTNTLEHEKPDSVFQDKNWALFWVFFNDIF